MASQAQINRSPGGAFEGDIDYRARYAFVESTNGVHNHTGKHHSPSSHV
jgi:hypothetical protein